jgi:hypothetical protein
MGPVDPVVNPCSSGPYFGVFGLVPVLHLDLGCFAILDFKVHDPYLLDVDAISSLKLVLHFVRGRVRYQSSHRDIPVVSTNSLNTLQDRSIVGANYWDVFFILNGFLQVPRLFGACG